MKSSDTREDAYMKIHNPAIKSLALCVALCAGGTAGAATLSTTGSFASLFNSTDYYDGSGVYSNLDVERSNVTGLQKFDPSLGTLTGVTLSTNFGVSVSAYVEAGYSIDPLQSHSVEFYATDGFTTGASTVVSYRVTPLSTSSLAFANVDIVPSCTGVEDIDGSPCNGSDAINYVFEDLSTIVGNTMDKIGIANLVGIGELTGLSVDILHADGGSIFTTLNVEPEESFGSIETSIGAGTVTLTYEYNPMVVPLPASGWLLVSALTAVGGRVARRKMARPAGA